jgi:PAS domain S-box-containing protein
MYQHLIRAVCIERDQARLSQAGLIVSLRGALRRWLQPARDGLEGTRANPQIDDMEGLSSAPIEPQSPDQEGPIRLRLAALVGLMVELILPIYQSIFLAQVERQSVEILAIWFALTLALFAATWHPGFQRIWKPATLLFAAAMIFTSGYWSIEGASPARLFFLLVLLPVGGACLPWDTPWQAGMSAICIIFGFAFASRLEWHAELVFSGLAAMLASIAGAHLFNRALTRYRERIDAYVKALSRSEKKFRKIFETGASVVAILTVPEAIMVDVNPAWEKAFAISRDQAIGQSPIALGLVDDTAAYKQFFAALRTGDTGAHKDPVVHRGRRDDPVYCLYSWAALELNDRLCVVVVGQDITGRMRAEEELRRHREAMANQERLTAVGELASGVAHDLNNNLNALRLNIELLRAQQRIAADYNDRLEVLSRIIADANSTVGRLQDFARRRHDRPLKPIDLGTIIHEALETIRTTLEKANTLSDRPTRIELDLPHLPLIVGELSDLRQVLVNLMLNALDAMPAGGTIRIGGKSLSAAVAVTVEDEGHGIAPEHLNRVFDPFFTTKSERGTGLGLSVAYSAMARLGGSITAANRPGGGAIFTLRFPLSPAQPVSRAAQWSRIKPRRIMVVDDDLNNLEALSGLFRARGHNVKASSSGLAALQELMREDCEVEIVFCDLGMPEINGWEVARQVRSRVAPPVFYLFTGWAQEIRADDPRRRWVDAVVAKPVEPKLLDQLLAEPSSVTQLPGPGLRRSS